METSPSEVVFLRGPSPGRVLLSGGKSRTDTIVKWFPMRVDLVTIETIGIEKHSPSREEIVIFVINA